LKTKQYSKELVLLSVEDSASVQMIYKSLFERLFKEVIFAENGKIALDMYEKADIIITDHLMPEMNGIELITSIREVDKNIPIILVTAFENLDILRDAIQLGINNFVKKPFDVKDLFTALDSAVELVMGHKYLLEKQETQISDLKEKEKYSNYQEDLSFKKELSLVRNDFYYHISEQELDDRFYISDFLYRPLDTLSGDLYSARQLGNNKELYFLVDGMGKGISASMTAILSTSFINYIIDRTLRLNREFDLKKMIEGVISFIRKHLLEDEVLAASFVLIDANALILEYSSFGMPAILLMDDKSNVKSLSSNNPPISIYSSKAKSTELSLIGMKKMLISSDGIHENSVNNGKESYAEYILEDFKNSMTSEDFFRKVSAKIDQQEDDMTYIFLHQIVLEDVLISNECQAKLKDVEELNDWYEMQMDLLCTDMVASTKSSLAFSEFSMNAYEHGALGITNKQKHTLLEEDTYMDYLAQKEQEVEGSIKVTIYKQTNANLDPYLLTKIEDSGEGFDTSIFSSIFGFHKNFNSRGVFMAKKSTLGIYYNNKGNIVYFFNKG